MAQAMVLDLARSNISAAEKFSEIYRQELWLKGGLSTGESESLSGHGSSLRSTELIREDLKALIDRERPEAFFDAPCGDFNWMRAVPFPEGCTYIGGDIVPSVIARNQDSYGVGDIATPGSRVFMVFDITRNPFPEANYWLCKDCLQHLSLEDVRAALTNFANSKVKMALISNHYGVRNNRDIATGDFRHLDLTLAPFNLPEPCFTLRDHPVDGEPRVVAAWTREQVAKALGI